MYISEKAVSSEFREQLAVMLPGLADNLAYWHMTGYLMFVAATEDGKRLIPAPLIALIEGKIHTSNYSAWKFLAAFQRDVVKMEVTAFQIGHCRAVTVIHWPKKVAALLAAERRKSGGDKVLLSTGAKWRREHTTKDRGQVQAEAIETLQNLGHHPAYDLLNLLNYAPKNRYAAVKKHMTAAHNLVDTLGLIPSEQERQHTILRAIEQQAQPFYKPGERSVRIFAINDSIVRLQRDVRATLTWDWISADLSSAQLAICARVWDVPEVADFLKAGRSIWKELSAWMGLDVTQYKPRLKDALYALVFGAGRDTMMEQFTTFPIGAYKRFTKHKLIRALLLARNKQLRTIRQKTGGEDAYGRWLEIAYIAVPGKIYRYDTSRRILALIAQSYELRLLTPVIELALTHKDASHGFCLLTWLHDGFTFSSYIDSDRQLWAMRLQKAVKQQAETLGIETTLEIE